MLAFGMLLCVGLLTQGAAASPNPTVRKMACGGTMFSLEDSPDTDSVVFTYLHARSWGRFNYKRQTGVKGGDGIWRWSSPFLQVADGDLFLYSVKVVSVYQSPTQVWRTGAQPPAPPPTPAAGVVMRDDFNSDTVDRSLWDYEVSAYGGYNWEFQVYVPEKNNSAIRDGKLYLQPTLTANHPDFTEAGLKTQRMTLTSMYGVCTNSERWGCERDGPSGLLPPVMSAKLKSRVSIKYGTVEVRARIPKGDWIWPAIWLLPRDSKYGGWPRSGEIDIMEARGNTVARDENGVNHGLNEVGSALHWGTAWNMNRYPLTVAANTKTSGDWHGWHTYKLDWTPEHITTYVDGVELLHVPAQEGGFWTKGNFTGTNIWQGRDNMAPFDQEFYLILNVAIGGTNGYFPDTLNYSTPKPWSNTSPQAAEDFWNGRNDWLPTWNGDDTAMIIDYVEMRTL